jgi:hypothetical protein
MSELYGLPELEKQIPQRLNSLLKNSKADPSPAEAGFGMTKIK